MTRLHSISQSAKKLRFWVLGTLEHAVCLLPIRWQAYARGRLRARHFPTDVFVEPTTQCNLKCLHCGRTYWKERDQHRDMDFLLFHRLAVESVEWGGVRALTIQGLGEPLLHPRIIDFILYAKQVGHFTRFNSNLTIMDPELAEKLVLSGHNEIMMSIESFEPSLYADIRRRSDLELVKRNLQLLKDTKVRLNAVYPIIRVNVVLMLSNLDQIEAIVAEARALGAVSVNFQGLNTDGIPDNARMRDGTRMRENVLSSLSDDEVTGIARRIQALDKPECPVTLWWDISGRRGATTGKNEIRVCSDIWERPYVDSAGKVTPCCLLPDGSIMSMGDMQNKSFGDIWHGEAFNQIRRQQLMGSPPPVCVNCQARNWVFNPTTGSFFNDQGEEFRDFFVRSGGRTTPALDAQETNKPRPATTKG